MKVKNSNIIIKEWKVKSKSDPSKHHIVGWNGNDYWVCDCAGYAFNKNCRHIRKVINKLNGLKYNNYKNK